MPLEIGDCEWAVFSLIFEDRVKKGRREKLKVVKNSSIIKFLLFRNRSVRSEKCDRYQTATNCKRLLLKALQFCCSAFGLFLDILPKYRISN